MKKIYQPILALLLTFIFLIPTFAADNGGGRTYRGYFNDVPEEAWFSSCVEEAYHRSLMQGTSWMNNDKTFVPDGELTREMAVAILFRTEMGDSTTARADYEAPSSFCDVKSGEWYSPYVVWAEKSGITNGIGDGAFGIGLPLSREELCTFVYRFVQTMEKKLADPTDTAMAFEDEAEVSEWAGDAVTYIKDHGLMLGDDNGYFRPADHITRAEAAAVFTRLDDALVFTGEDLFAFEAEDVSLIRISENPPYNISVDITDKEEIAETLAYLKNAKITKSEAMGALAGTGDTISVYGKSGEHLIGYSFSASSLYRSGERKYILEEGYLEKYDDMLKAQ